MATDTETILSAFVAEPGSWPTHSLTNREVFHAGYVEAMFWANACDETGGNPFAGDDPGYPLGAMTAALTAELNQQADDFLTPETVELIAAASDDPTQSYDFGQAGHDFALTRNRHGAGFWDRGIDQGDELTAMAQSEGSATIYVGDPDDPKTWTLE